MSLFGQLKKKRTLDQKRAHWIYKVYFSLHFGTYLMTVDLMVCQPASSKGVGARATLIRT